MQKNRRPIRILIVDDHSVVREGLRALLSAVHDIEIIAEAADGMEAIAAITKWKPDVTLMDLLMPKLDGVQATRRILKAHPEAKILVLTTIPNWYKVDLCLDAGACGYVLKSAPSAEIFSAIRKAHAGQVAFSRNGCNMIQTAHVHLSGPTVAGDNESLPLSRQPNQLSPREAQVLGLLADGHNNKEISDQLAIAVKTVEKHRQRVMDKLNLHDVASLTRYALANGFVQDLPLSSVHLAQ